MTYSLHTLTHSPSSAEEEVEPRNFWARFAQEIGLLLGAGLLLLCFLAWVSYHPQDAAWSTSGTGGSIRNWLGRWGAWIADLSFFALGYSAWWCFAAGLRAWLSGLARWMGSSDRENVEGTRGIQRRAWVFWLGLLVLLVASAGLEWTRLYRWEANLPGHSGGILGFEVGQLGMHWLGFTGSALVGLVLAVVGLAMVFRFSWGQLAERIGERIDRLIQTRHAKKEIEEDMALGQQALREREQISSLQPVEPQWDIDEAALGAPEGQLDLEPVLVPAPQVPSVVIEPAVMDVPRSERVVKERQKPLFNELPDSKLPQVDLLDPLTARQETVSPETLEMTSRLIEKKLSDFGVKVRVVAAAPGPVITRYEIEPDTGVKGSQVVNLAKDLARSLSLVSIRVIETIPGKNYMALELPNAKRQSI